MTLCTGDTLLDIPSGHGRPSSQHFTVIFNAFVMMTLFNEFNARKIHGQRNVFEGVLTNPIFYLIWIGTFVSQVRLTSMRLFLMFDNVSVYTGCDHSVWSHGVRYQEADDGAVVVVPALRYWHAVVGSVDHLYETECPPQNCLHNLYSKMKGKLLKTPIE